MTIFSFFETLLLGPLKLVFEIIFMAANDILKHPGFSIIALSMVMNILVLPLYRRADAMQEAVRDNEARLSKGVEHIKKVFSGDERMMIMQTYYRQNNYKPTDSLKGSVSLLLEIPFFMAAYQFLSTAGILRGVPLGPITDLSVPDGLVVIGSMTINLLPFLMTFINFISSAIYLKGFPLKTKIQLYGMALFFLVFLYDSPAGLVFYWTLNNLFSLVKTVFYKLKNPKKVLNVLLSVLGIAAILTAFTLADALSPKVRIVLCLLGVLLQFPMIGRFVKPLLPKAKETVANPKRSHFILGAVFLTILIGLYIPSVFVAASPQEYVDITYFHHPMNYLVNSLVLAAGTFIIWMSVFYWLASPKGKVIFEKLIWALSVAMVINYMFFATDLGVISPELKYDNGMAFTVTEQLINLGITLVVIAVVYLIATKWKAFCSGIIVTTAIAIGCMSVMNVNTINKSIDDLTKDSFVLGKPAIELSKDGKNVIVLMLDRAAGAFVPYMFNEKPELKEQFDGFTYYDNVLAFSPATRFSTPALYGGYEYTPMAMNERDDMLLVDKHNEALKVLPVLFLENEYRVSVCNPPFTNYKWVPDMSIYSEYPQINTITTDVMYNDVTMKKQNIENNYRNFFVFSVMKTMPLTLQTAVYDEGTYNRMISDDEVTGVQTTSSASVADGITWRFQSNYEVFQNLPQMTAITQDGNNTFLSMQSEITHAPTLLQMPDYVPAVHVNNTDYDNAHKDRFTLDGKSIRVENEEQMTHYHCNMAALLQLGNWFDYMREQGVYDNTRIILVSDHSWSLFSMEDMIVDGTNKLKNLEIYFPLLMVKDFDSEGFTTSSEFMTIADVPALATEEIFDKPKNPFTGMEIDSNEKNLQEQYVFMNWDNGPTNGTTFHASPWASVRDNMRDPANWTFLDTAIIPGEK